MRAAGGREGAQGKMAGHEGPSSGEGLRGETGGNGEKREGDSELVVFCKVDQR